jgi:hypothetical protein
MFPSYQHIAHGFLSRVTVRPRFSFGRDHGAKCPDELARRCVSAARPALYSVI